LELQVKPHAWLVHVAVPLVGAVQSEAVQQPVDAMHAGPPLLLLQ
jgi:hypothetical protein